eukprot:jgi/Undpi1/8746/HiC_scaffold_25.g11208.m1
MSMTIPTTPFQASAGAPAMKSVAAAAEASFSAPACGQEPTASEVAKPVLATPASSSSASRAQSRGRRSQIAVIGGGGFVTPAPERGINLAKNGDGPAAPKRVINLANNTESDTPALERIINRVNGHDDDVAAAAAAANSENAIPDSENTVYSENSAYSKNDMPNSENAFAGSENAFADPEGVADSENAVAGSDTDFTGLEYVPNWESVVGAESVDHSEIVVDSEAVADSESVADSEAVVDSEPAANSGGGDSEADSLALARTLMEEEAMASYSAAVDILRGTEGGIDGIDGVAAEDMAAMQALLEEDERSQRTYAMAEDESLDYDGMLELGTAIGDVRKERWRLRCNSVIDALPRVSYTARGSSARGEGEGDTKCLVCQCDFEELEELTRLPCGHFFHTGGSKQSGSSSVTPVFRIT